VSPPASPALLKLSNDLSNLSAKQVFGCDFPLSVVAADVGAVAADAAVVADVADVADVVGAFGVSADFGAGEMAVFMI
jgi:hypothetical protein